MLGWGVLGSVTVEKVRLEERELNPASEARKGTLYPPQLFVILHGDSQMAEEPGVRRIPCGSSGLRAGEWNQSWVHSWC